MNEELNEKLIRAANVGYLEEIKRLIKSGADVNVADNQGRTALHAAAGTSLYLSKNTEVVKMLIAEGADVNAADNQGRTALHAAAGTSLYLSKNTEVVKMLIAKGADVNAADNQGRTALHIAAEEGHAEIAELLTLDADVLVDINGRTALHIAAERGRAEVAKVLIAWWAEQHLLPWISRFFLNAMDKYGNTALYVAAYKGHAEVAKVLLVNGANPDLENKDGKTAWDMIKGKKKMEFVFNKALEEWYNKQ